MAYRVDAQRLTVAGIADGVPLLSMRTHWYCTREHEPHWQLAEPIPVPRLGDAS
jgi:4-hydroxy-tetrahydrodipicolinate reductase